MAEGWHTQAELVAAARAAGFSIDEKLIERWVGAGLLDMAQTDGRGDRKGVGRRWPDSQRDLLLSLLGHHRTARELTTLANVPVIVWAIWGEDFVPLRQVRRALETYARVDRRRRPWRGQAWARRLVTRIAKPGTSGHQRDVLAEALLHALEHDSLDDPALARRFADVVGPADPDAQSDGPRMLAIVKAQWTGRARFHEFTDGHFRWARAFLLHAQADYAVARPTLAADPRFGPLHQPFTLQTVASEACHSLLMLLGMTMSERIDENLEPPLQLAPWLEGRARLATRVAEVGSLSGAGFSIPAGLSIEVSVEISPPADAAAAPG